jgi:hypothetical protein
MSLLSRSYIVQTPPLRKRKKDIKNGMYSTLLEPMINVPCFAAS